MKARLITVQLLLPTSDSLESSRLCARLHNVRSQLGDWMEYSITEDLEVEVEDLRGMGTGCFHDWFDGATSRDVKVS